MRERRRHEHRRRGHIRRGKRCRGRRRQEPVAVAGAADLLGGGRRDRAEPAGSGRVDRPRRHGSIVGGEGLRHERRQASPAADVSPQRSRPTVPGSHLIPLPALRWHSCPQNHASQTPRSTSTAWHVTEMRARPPPKPLMRWSRYDEKTRKSPGRIRVVVRVTAGSSSMGQFCPCHVLLKSVSPPRVVGGCSIHTTDRAVGRAARHVGVRPSRS